MLALFALPLSAQVRGVPASVTSYGFGGHFNATPGPPASVTSLGPNGYHNNNTWHSPRPVCCGTFSSGRHQPGLNRPRRGAFYNGYSSLYAVPYPVYGVPDEPPAPEDQFPEEEYRGGPTIFDRRGPGPSWLEEDADTREPEPAHEARQESPAPAADQPATLLVFKDGRQMEIRNYAIVGDTLVDLTEGHRRKVPLAELDVEATAKQNDDRGIDFSLPVKAN
jgi:hypothetical protein